MHDEVDNIAEEDIPLYPVFEVATFMCPGCKGVLKLSVFQVSMMVYEKPLKCSLCRQPIALGSTGESELLRRNQCVKTLNSSMNVIYVLLLLLSLIVAFTVAAELGGGIGALGTLILAGMRYICSFGKPAILLASGGINLEKRDR